MSKEFILFDNDDSGFVVKFYRLMDLLVTNKSSSRMESVIFLGIFYIQMLAGFFSFQLKVLDRDNSDSDTYLNYITRIFRVKDLLTESFSGFQVAIYILLGLLVVLTLWFIYLILKISKNSFYTLKEFLMNFFIKSFIYVAFNPILDLTLTILCFENKNPYFDNVTCSLSDNMHVFIIALILIIYSIILCFFVNMFYNDSSFLSNSNYSRMSCGYEIYLVLNQIIYAILLSQAKYIGKEIFLLYNLVVSLIFLKFYFAKYLYYDKVTNSIVGMFHILYSWTSIYFLIFAYVKMEEKGIIYLLGCVIIIYLYFNLKQRMEDHIILNIPFHKITNKYHLLFYLKNLIDKIHNIESCIEAKAELIGIIQLHSVECPSDSCITKHKHKKIYLPFLDEWTSRDKPEINDKVFLLNFIIVMMNYFINQNYYSPEMLINLSLYYLQIVGNNCQSMFYYKKVKEMKLSVQENFSFIRLNFLISKVLMEKVKSSFEGSTQLEDLNTTLYFKYEDLSQKFFDEINNDINLSLEFWKSFKTHLESNRPLDFNKIFSLTDKIRLTKNKIDKIWNDLYCTYAGVNDLFSLYENYVEQINDDDMLKRELDVIKNKNVNSSDQLQFNYYNFLFNKETGIIIANGDKSKEGLIEKTNDEIDKIFDYKSDELKGMNVNLLMPKIFEKNHKSFMERYLEVGEKRVIDKQFKAFGKDKENSLIPIQLIIKLFPILNDNIYFCSMIIKENLDDVILIDSKFNIQGISKKLMTKIGMDNKNLFHDCEIPFYIICKKFINFYKNSIKSKKQKKKKVQNEGNDNLIDLDNKNEIEHKESENLNQMDVEIINETVELEFEIKIPHFLKEYVSSISKRENKSDFKLMKNDTTETKDEIEQLDDVDENENLVKEETVSRQSRTKERPSTQNTKFNFNKQSDEDKEFQNKLAKYKMLFDTNKFYELDEYINKNNNEKNDFKEFKFIFTFDKYSFGDKQLAYIIRCIDNKQEYEDGSVSDETEEGNNAEKVRVGEHQKKKMSTMGKLNELTEEDKRIVLENQAEYPKLCVEDKDFCKMQLDHKEEIKMNTKIFGFKQEEQQIDDENSSQSSQSGFKNDMANKSRIEEIRSNLMKNVANFYLLKWIKAIFYIAIVLTAAFCGFYLMIFDLIYQDMNSISSLNIGLFQTTIWMSNIITSIISMRSLYKFKQTNFPIKFNSYLANEQQYFEMLRSQTLKWYSNVMTIFGPVESNINLYFTSAYSAEALFWKAQDVTYPKGSELVMDKESFPLALSQILSNTNNIVKNKFFSIDPAILSSNSKMHTEHIKYFIDHSSYLSIENSIDNLLPRLYEILQKSPAIFSNYNIDNTRWVYIILASYAFAIIIIAVFYSIFLYLTNKNMEEGLQKVSKIDGNNIEDTIRRIEMFNEKCLSKYRHKENSIKSSQDDQKPETKNESTTVTSKDKFQSYSDGPKYKSLKILTYSYFQIPGIISILCALLIPIYVVSYGMIQSSNQILSVQNYIFGKALTASTSTVYIKCIISECDIKSNINYIVDFVDTTQVESIVKDISNFPELSDFYSNKFLLNACQVIYDPNLNQTQYTDCMNDVVIRSANNTDSLLKLIDETVSTITKDKEMKQGKPYIDSNNVTKVFMNPLLYETKHFRDLEYVFYNYITPISDSFAVVVSTSLVNFLQSKRVIIIILICVIGVIILCISFYIAFIFTNKLIHLLSVARCILKIIPTGVINNTQELKNWIENKY